MLIPLNVEWDTAALGRHVHFETHRRLADLDGQALCSIRTPGPLWSASILPSADCSKRSKLDVARPSPS